MTELRKEIKKAARVYLEVDGQTARINKKRARRLAKHNPPYRLFEGSLYIAVEIPKGGGKGDRGKGSKDAPRDVKESAKQTPAKRTPVNSELGDIKWIPVSELIDVWLASPFGKMRPPSENWGSQSLMSLDREYAVLTLEQAKRILAETVVDDIVWQSEKTDCDNIARYMAARVSILYGVNAVAVVDAIDEGHSYCAFLLHDDGEPYLRAFEPQTDQWRDDVEPKEGWIHFG